VPHYSIDHLNGSGRVKATIGSTRPTTANEATAAATP
jgi:hypothetical protein